MIWVIIALAISFVCSHYLIKLIDLLYELIIIEYGKFRKKMIHARNRKRSPEQIQGAVIHVKLK